MLICVKMLGDRDVRRMIEKALDKVYDDIRQNNINKDNPDRIHALEASRCTRLSYYERKDSLPFDNVTKMSILLLEGIRRSFNSVNSEYKVDNLILEAKADMIVNNEFILRFEVVTNLPEIPHPRDLLYLNACLFAFDKNEGILIYITSKGETVEFSITKSNRMFEEVIRRARILSTLLKEGKVPIVEPCELCLKCKYYERCYSREKKTSSFSLENILGFEKRST
jgi:CRISPR-associated exonuclease Cas4